MTPHREETLVEQRVTYTLEWDGRLVMVENVPARVNPETGEQFFAPETVEHLQKTIHAGKAPQRVVETPVYDYAA